MDDNTFINMDEVRGWGIRGLRQVHGKDMTKRRDKYYVIALVGVALTTIGMSMMIDGYHKAGKYQGAMNVCSERMDEALLKDMERQGYKLAGK